MKSPSHGLQNSGSVPERLARRLGVFDAVMLGLGSMIGAGIFVAAAPAARAAGGWLLPALLIAGLIALLNALSMAQLSARYPESGGTYVYGRRRLGPVWGFLAGWSFVVGKLASCTAMALAFASYAAPASARPLAVAAVLALTLVNYFGIRKTALATKVLVATVLATLAVAVFATLAGGQADPQRLRALLQFDPTMGGIYGLLQGAGILFFAFAGYARIATLGEEVIDPRKIIPKAILLALGLTVFVYFTVIVTLLVSLDLRALANSPAPLALAVESGLFHQLVPLVRFGACCASLSVLLSLMAGIGRTVFAMSAEGDLPRWWSAVHPTHKVPHRAELTVGLIVAAVVSVADLRLAIGFSSFAILIYYAIANAAAWTLGPAERLWPRSLTIAGGLACLILAAALPAASIVAGLLFLAVGLAVYGAIQLRSRGSRVFF